jgi:hypothetical protein
MKRTNNDNYMTIKWQTIIKWNYFISK